MARIIVLGSSNTDLVIRSSRLPLRGETVLGTDYRQVPGGKGANQAVASARAGGAVCFVAAVGADPFGRAALEHYRDEGLEIGYIRTRRHSESGVALILVDDSGANMIAVHGGANQTLSASEIARLPKRLFREAKVFVSQFEIPFEAVRCGLERARKAKCLTILNPAPAQPIKSVRHLLPLVDILIPNESEAAFMTGREVRDEPSAKAAAVQLLRRGCGNVIITLGSRGCLVACAGNDEREITFDPIPALRVRAVDTVAAGDAFVGVLAATLAEQPEGGKSFRERLIEAARRATHAAAISVTRHGAQPSLPYRREIDQSLARQNRKIKSS